jgi:biotin carboxylase
MPELLLIGVGCMGRPYVTAAERLGARVRVIESSTGAIAAAEIASEVRAAPGELEEALAGTAYACAAERVPNAVVAFSEEHVLAAALVRDMLALPGPSLHASVLSRNKALQRGCFAAAGLRQPDHLVVECLREARHWVSARFPVVIKPLSSTGSEGVELVADPRAFAVAAARRVDHGPVLVETAIRGPEYSWEGLVRDGHVWFSNVTAKETTGPPQFVELVHRAAASLGEDTAAEVDRLAAGVIAAMRLSSGLVHLEFRLAESGPTIMEVAVRTPGDFIMEVLGLTYGVDLFEMTLRVALGLTLPDPPSDPVRYAASCWLVAPPGVVTAVHGLDEVRAHTGVHHAEIEVTAGAVVEPLRSWRERVGSVVVVADTRAELERSLSFVRRTLTVHTRPVHGSDGRGLSARPDAKREYQSGEPAALQDA